MEFVCLLFFLFVFFLFVFFDDDLDPFLPGVPSFMCFSSLVPQTRRIRQKPTPQLWLGREIPFDPEAASGTVAMYGGTC